MKRKLTQFFALALLQLASVSPSATASPMGTAFTYQGRLYDHGAPVNGYFDFQFRLYASANAADRVPGTPDPFVLPGVLVTNGLFTVNLDFGAGAFTGPARWLETSVATNTVTDYSLLSPRQELQPTPYALHAGSADSALVAGSISPGGISAAGLAPGAVGSTAIADGSIGLADLSEAVLQNTFWRLQGNAGTVPGRDFLGTTDDKTLTVKVNNETVMRFQPHPGAPSIIGGDPGNFISSGAGGAVIGGGGDTRLGLINQVWNDHSVIAGGLGNYVAGRESFIGGGWGNTSADANSHYVVIAGGTNNFVNVDQGVIGGGIDNSVRGISSVIAGGARNTASGPESAIGGGRGNLVAGPNGTIAGGIGNTSTAPYASIGGGYGNRAAGQDSVVAGGSGNSADSGQSTVGGGIGNHAVGSSATVGGGRANLSTNNYATVSGGYGNLAAGQDSAVSGGSGNAALAGQSSVGGGIGNRATGSASSISGGQANTNQAAFGAIGGGTANVITTNADASVIDGGRNNRIESFDAGIGIASATGSAISGGERNLITGAMNAAILGGANNRAAGFASAVLAGEQNAADFDHSVVSGNGAVARRSASVTHGAMFAQPGDGQSARYALTATTPGTVSQLLTGPRLPVGSAFAFSTLISAKAFGNASAGFEVKGLIRNYGTEVLFVGSPTITILGRDGALASATVTVEVGSSGALAFRVSSGSTLNVRWVGTVQTSEVSF